MVRRLIQEQQVRALHANHGKHKTRLLTFREFANLLRLHTTRDTVSPKVSPPFFVLSLPRERVRVLLHEKLERVHVLVQHVDGVLMVLADAERGMAIDRTDRRRELASHEFQ